MPTVWATQFYESWVVLFFLTDYFNSPAKTGGTKWNTKTGMALKKAYGRTKLT